MADREKVLELRKEILPMKDAYEQLTLDERDELESLQEKHDEMYSNLSKEDLKWYDDEFGKWYSKYLEIETKIFIKPCEG
jgi:hypothetical protein